MTQISAQLGRAPLLKIRMLAFCVAMFGAALAESAIARPVIVRATVPTFGCARATELQHVSVKALVTHGSLPGGCFHIAAGMLAYTAPEWQRSGLDLWRNVAILETRSGRRFYSWPSTWRYAGEVPRFVR